VLIAQHGPELETQTEHPSTTHGALDGGRETYVSAAACAEVSDLMINDYDKTIFTDKKKKNTVTKGGLLASVQLARCVRKRRLPG